MVWLWRCSEGYKDSGISCVHNFDCNTKGGWEDGGCMATPASQLICYPIMLHVAQGITYEETLYNP